MSRQRGRWPLPLEAEAHIVAELNRGGVDWKDGSRRNIKMNCFRPHEKGPDLGYNLEITRDGRMAHCWVCDWSGSWNKLAKELGLAAFSVKTFDTDTYSAKVADTNVFGKLLDDFDDVVESIDSQELPSNELFPWRLKEWRGLSRSFLKLIPTYLWKQEVQLRNRNTGKVFKTFVVDRVLWPYYQYDRLVGYVGRRLDGSDALKYYRAGWCKARECFFPFDYVRLNFDGEDTVVLVEGEVDALVLLQAGIPALSILGSNNWSDTKRDLLLSLGVSRVILLMDGDFAGRKAAKEIKNSLSEYMEVVVLGLHDGEDPGSLDEEQIEWLASRVYP